MSCRPPKERSPTLATVTVSGHHVIPVIRTTPTPGVACTLPGIRASKVPMAIQQSRNCRIMPEDRDRLTPPGVRQRWVSGRTPGAPRHSGY
jgi:hypothetical protein